MFQDDKLEFLHNLVISYLNINTLRNKVIGLGKIPKELPLHHLVISETKLDKVSQIPN